MRHFFLDTSFVLALINKHDQWNAPASDLQSQIVSEGWRCVTTEYVLIEVGDALAAVHRREMGARVIKTLRSNPGVNIEPSSSKLFIEGFHLFCSRSDKGWGLTDCISFCVMNRYQLTEALTGDRHFQQAGFRALLLD